MDNNWNKNTEAVVEKIRDDSLLNRSVHTHLAKKALFRYNALTVTGMIVGPVTGILAGSKEVICDTDHITTGIIIGLSLISSIVISAVKLGNLEETCHLHRQAVSNYLVIENNINLQLATEKSNRIQADEYIKWLQLKYEDVFDKSPLINFNTRYEIKPKSDIENGNIDDDNILKYEMNRMMRN